MLSVLSIETRFACDKYKNLVFSVASVEIFVWFVTSIESCILHGEYSGDYRNLVLSMTSIEILCCLWQL